MIAGVLVLAQRVAASPFNAENVGLVVLLITLALLVALLAERFRFPYTLALVLVGLLLGVLRVAPRVHLDPDAVLFLFLPALLFEGAWNLDVRSLLANWRAVALLALPGLALSLGVVALIVHLGVGVPWLVALTLGAIISPTDPVAVIALLKQLGMPARLRVIIEGESLFNDGVGAAAYQLALAGLLVTLRLDGGVAGLGGWALAAKALWLVLGGPLIGATVGLAVSLLVRAVDDPIVEMTITFGVAYGVYALGDLLGASGLLAVVCAGLVLGSYGRLTSMSARTLERVDGVWEFIGFLANALLFLLLGIQIGASNFAYALPAILWATLGVFAGRLLMIYTLLPLHDLLARSRSDPYEKPLASPASPGATAAARRVSPTPPPERDLGWTFHAVRRALTRRPAPIPHLWRPLLLLSGLRGALSLALALNLPPDVPQRELLQFIVYGVVLVTLVGQGLGLRLLLPRWPRVEGVPHT